VLIREAKVVDAAAFVALFDQINSETTFMLFERGESPRNVEQQSRIFEEWAKTGSGVMFVCEEDKELIGFVAGHRGVGRRQAHSIYIAMGVLQAWVGRGIGRSLLEAFEGWAQSKGLHRLELQSITTCPCGEPALRHLFFAGDGNPSVSNSASVSSGLLWLR
jgi:GNAT superfamily N-acetyltransferase